jgi:angio-associated migratory cell protein
VNLEADCLFQKCRTFFAIGLHACTGYEDGTIKFWNLSNCKCLHTFAGGKMGHASQVTCIDCHKNNNIVVTGSTDATALLINVRSGKVNPDRYFLHQTLTFVLKGVSE